MSAHTTATHLPMQSRAVCKSGRFVRYIGTFLLGQVTSRISPWIFHLLELPYLARGLAFFAICESVRKCFQQRKECRAPAVVAIARIVLRFAFLCTATNPDLQFFIKTYCFFCLATLSGKRSRLFQKRPYKYQIPRASCT